MSRKPVRARASVLGVAFVLAVPALAFSASFLEDKSDGKGYEDA